jgi:hypothetical protein
VKEHDMLNMYKRGKIEKLKAKLYDEHETERSDMQTPLYMV